MPLSLAMCFLSSSHHGLDTRQIFYGPHYSFPKQFYFSIFNTLLYNLIIFLISFYFCIFILVFSLFYILVIKLIKK